MSPTAVSRCEIRPADAADAQAIARLIVPYAAQGIVLPRPEEEIRASIGDFLVACHGDKVVGCVALRPYGQGLQELRTLVVQAEHAGGGLGSRLVKAAVREARRRGCRTLFTLTVRPRLFQRLGFRIVEASRFPQKVWSDCANCPKRDCCDEVALVMELSPADS